MEIELIKIKALKCTQNEVSFYISNINSKILKDLCYVTRREEDPNEGFQRLLNNNKAKAITKYLDTEKKHIPTALILSAQEDTNFKFNEKTNEISFEDKKESFLIIDGQHRLYGLSQCKESYDFPVVIYSELEKSEEVNLFIDINTTQKGVPTALILDIKNLAGSETSKEEKMRFIFNKLNEKSILSGMLSPSKSANNKISRALFNESLSSIIDVEPLKGKTPEIIFNAMNNYYTAFDYILNKSGSKSKITNASLFKAICNIFPDIATRSLREFGNLKVDSVLSITEDISNIDFSQFKGSGNAVVASISKEMKSIINKTISLSSECF